MALDLSTNKWEHLSGSSEHVPIISTQPPFPTMHVGCSKASANWTQVRYKQAAGAAECDYTYDDFWSWPANGKKWDCEQMGGGYPSPRTEAASDTMYEFAFYGDTFIYDPEANLWQHVPVRGFPSYRAMSTIVSDPDTGKIYLFGGYTNLDFVPAKNFSLQAFNDILTLKLDLPGGHWNPDDLTRDVRAGKTGPRMRVALPAYAGACGGKYFFGSKDCQRRGWKEHNEKYGCRKLYRRDSCAKV
ncbi:hypothetical protein F5876DRAFT_86746 [Lentinula aff. lateritia]|uniref:Uncharacterized protein n=1 Tax=Lentinula aff. lateritia TaxID=2804960 RepID=A0ACC1UAZ4_9AGAR|nr:hypothetical protein F5876DRAFT_86746 [Lentinula aff. lateritia]